MQGNHLHFVVEGENRHCLARRHAGAERARRYHAHILKTLAEVRTPFITFATTSKSIATPDDWYVDPYSSTCGEAPWYMQEYDWGALVIAAPTTWLLRRVN